MCAAVSVFAFVLVIGDLLRSIALEKQEKSEEFKRIPFVFRLAMPFTGFFTAHIHNSESMKNTLEQTSSLLSMAGYDQVFKPEQFIAIRIIMAVYGVVGTVLFFTASEPLCGLLFAMVMFLYPNSWIKGIVRRRHTEIFKALPNVLDLLTLSVEAGKDFLTALRDIMYSRRPDAIGEELNRALHEIQLGKQRQTALREMSQRVQQSDLTGVVNAIIQADELGVSIGQLLRIQGDQLRVKRFTRAEKLANEAPVKILFPVIVFIFPSVFLILMGPIVMQAGKTVGM